MRWPVFGSLLAANAIARADAPPPPPADDVRDAPRPGQEHGRKDPLDHEDSLARKVARAVLWIPRLPFELVARPVRGVLELQDRYEIIQPPGTVSFMPTLLVDSDFGV